MIYFYNLLELFLIIIYIILFIYGRKLFIKVNEGFVVCMDGKFLSFDGLG